MLRVHSSFHKCLTMLFYRTMDDALNKYTLSFKKKYRHFESIEGLFYNLNKDYYINSINNFAPDLLQFQEDFRITRFVRDPRDLVVSGYFYHKRGAEPWFRFKNPTAKYWSDINGNVPLGMGRGQTYAEYLNSLSKEEGLKAEIEFRMHHLTSMLDWPEDNRIKLFRYEDIIDNQAGAFEDIVSHYEIEGFTRKRILHFSKMYALENRRGDKHIRNSSTGQWRAHFTPELNEYFLERYSDILDRYNYSKN